MENSREQRTNFVCITFAQYCTYMYACSVVHITRICCFEFCYLEFSFGYLEFSNLEFSRKIMNFSLGTVRKIFRKFDYFSWKIRENKGWLSTNFVCITFAQYCTQEISRKQMKAFVQKGRISVFGLIFIFRRLPGSS